MKIALCSLLLALSLPAVLGGTQPTNAPGGMTTPPPPTGRGPSVTRIQPITPIQTSGQRTLREPRPNEILTDRFSYSGIAVELTKTRRPYQLLNPLAPPAYGPAEDNVVRNPINGQISGLKIFSIGF